MSESGTTITDRIFHVNLAPLAYKKGVEGISTQAIIVHPTHIGLRAIILWEA
jgi:hypothetical protein